MLKMDNALQAESLIGSPKVKLPPAASAPTIPRSRFVLL